MRICILTPGDPIKKSHRSSSERFIDLLAPQLSKAEWVTIHCLEDELPLDVKEFDAYLITGGKYSVFEDLDWQHSLFDLIRKVYQNNIPIVGICYGHQALAHALGGQVERFDNGWGAGVTTVNIINQPDHLVHELELGGHNICPRLECCFGRPFGLSQISYVASQGLQILNISHP
jgi:GMP synthase-like glutamine amidotransferase